MIKSPIKSPARDITEQRATLTRAPNERQQAHALFALAMLAVGALTLFLLSVAGQPLAPRLTARTTQTTHTTATSESKVQGGIPAPLRTFPMPVANVDRK